MLQEYGIYNYNTLMKQDKPKEAIPCLEKSLIYASSDKEKYDVYEKLGECYLKLVYY